MKSAHLKIVDNRHLQALTTLFLQNNPGDKYLVAYDMRLHANELFAEVVKTLKVHDKHVDLLDHGVLKQLQVEITRHEYAGGIFLTSETAGAQVKGVIFLGIDGNIIEREDYQNLNWDDFGYIEDQVGDQYKKVNYNDDYYNYLAENSGLNEIKNLKVLIDAGNGMAGEHLHKFCDKLLHLEIVEKAYEPNAKFPHHLPNIENLGYAASLKDKLDESGAAFGAVFDFHGNEFNLVDNKGQVLPYSKLEKFGGEGILRFLNLLQRASQDMGELYQLFSTEHEPVAEMEDISELRGEFEELLGNLWFTWNPHHILPVIDLYGDGWRKNSPPTDFITQYGKKRIAQLLQDNAWEVSANYRVFSNYLADKQNWFEFNKTEENHGLMEQMQTNPIAYFCLEYGLVDWLQIYSGGLGVLAGDFLKQASDMGVPMVAVGIFYHEGYFHQDFGENGEQLERYIHQDPDDYPFELARDEHGEPIEVMVEIAGHEVYARAWTLEVGRVKLYLLDTNFNRNEIWEDRKITAHLYGGNEDTRIRQEILMGIGGARLLKELKVEPSIYHMNEGHSGFLTLELAKKYVDQGVDFKEAIDKASQNLIFTNHTLKQAGNDIFPYTLIEKHLGSYTDDLQASVEDIYDLGKDELYAQGEFSMTLLGLRHAKVSNAVSILHGQAAKKLWPDYELLPITNGVHMPTWVSPEIHELLDRYVGEGWHYPENEVDFELVHEIPESELWQAHTVRKQKLIHSLNNELGLQLDPAALTIGWSRRLTSYKRPDLIVSDTERLRALISQTDKPVQILIAGKAHPKDSVGKEVLQRMNQKLSAPEFKNKVVLIPGYNWQLARRIISGVDVWLNTPYRFEEASGTSGMKAAANGVIQLTTKDGWTDEVDWYEKGWLIDEADPGKSLHDTLEYQVIPLYFDRIGDGYNEYWVKMMLNSMELVLDHYSTKRMMRQYLEDIYLPILREYNKLD